jgi:hypothetical protein
MRPVSRPVNRANCFLSVRILLQQILGLPLHQVQGVRDQGVRVRRAERVQERQVDQQGEARQQVRLHQPKKGFVTLPVSLKSLHRQLLVLQMKNVQRAVARSVADHLQVGRVLPRVQQPLVVANRWAELQDNVFLNAPSGLRRRNVRATLKERMTRHQPEFVEAFVKRRVARQVSVSEFLVPHVFVEVQLLRAVHRAEPPLRADQAAERRLDQVAETVGMGGVLHSERVAEVSVW